MKSRETTIYKKRLLGLLPRGGVDRIAAALNLHQSTVSRALSGKTKNLLVIEEAIRIIEEEKELEKKLNDKIRSL